MIHQFSWISFCIRFDDILGAMENETLFNVGLSKFLRNKT